MKKIFVILAAAAALVSCRSLIEEWQPVFGDPSPSAQIHLYSDTDLPSGAPALSEFKTIKELKAMYKSGPVEVPAGVWVKGTVISSDRSGNLYKELYIQDATGGIDLKLGKSSLYSEYTLGQTLYVKCSGLTLGAYNGMPQLGMEADQTSTNEYETSYMDLQTIIDQHIFKGQRGEPLAPTSVTEAEIAASISTGFTGELWGKLVKIDGLKYGASSSYSTDNFKRIFILLYVDQYLNKKAGENRIFCSRETYGVNTWAMSKKKFLEYLDNGNFDNCQTNGNLGMNDKFTSFDKDNTKTVKQTLRENAVAVTTSHYFHVGSTAVQIRTSGYSRFSDTEIDASIIGDVNSKTDGAAISATGILTVYNGAAQLTLVDDPSVSVKVN